jgi:hypothetical protein
VIEGCPDLLGHLPFAAGQVAPGGPENDAAGVDEGVLPPPVPLEDVPAAVGRPPSRPRSLVAPRPSPVDDMTNGDPVDGSTPPSIVAPRRRAPGTRWPATRTGDQGVAVVVDAGPVPVPFVAVTLTV